MPVYMGRFTNYRMDITGAIYLKNLKEKPQKTKGNVKISPADQSYLQIHGSLFCLQKVTLPVENDQRRICRVISRWRVHSKVMALYKGWY